ncbi:MAG: HAD family hydrolase [Planctomycetes bacterium]|jgi:D-glycero-D-manno-heptose 1,7-bisphosphate phosphatase|nr:HAD family hydrolase [Planctomycetota bacterium]
MTPFPRKAVFIDRDGTINHQVGYCGDPARIVLIDNAARAIARINEMGLLAVVVTNQSAVARGLITEAQVRRVNSEVALKVAQEAGARIDAFYYCPHHPTEGNVAEFTRQCDCRKPHGGMLRKAAKEFDIALEESFMVGDADIDHQAAKDAHPELVTFSLPSTYNHGLGDVQVASLWQAVEQISQIMAVR